MLSSMSTSKRKREDAERAEFRRMLTEATEEEKLAYLTNRARKRRIQDSLSSTVSLPVVFIERRSTLERRTGVDRRREDIPVENDRRHPTNDRRRVTNRREWYN